MNDVIAQAKAAASFKALERDKTTAKVVGSEFVSFESGRKADASQAQKCTRNASRYRLRRIFLINFAEVIGIEAGPGVAVLGIQIE